MQKSGYLTNSNASLTTKEIVQTYKKEREIEDSFRVIKDVIEIRPVYHYAPKRVKAHVFVCVLSYLITRLLEQKTGSTIKMLKEKYMTSVILEGRENQQEAIPSFLQAI